MNGPCRTLATLASLGTLASLASLASLATLSAVACNVQHQGAPDIGGVFVDAGVVEDAAPPVDADAGAVPDTSPTVTRMQPTAGDYGTRITIEGTHLLAEDARLELDGPGGKVVYTRKGSKTYPGDVPGPTHVLQAWTDTKIEFKYPFPAEGGVRVIVGQRGATAGTFAPSWSPGTTTTDVLKRGVRAAVSPAPGAIAALVYDGAGLHAVRADAVSARTDDLDATGTTRADLYVTPNGDVGGFFAIEGADPILTHVTFAAGAPTSTSTGVHLAPARAFFAAGADATGPFAWVQKTPGQVVRVRPPAWAEDTAPVSVPAASTHTSAGSIGRDGSVYMAWGEDTGVSPFVESLPSAARLRPGQTAFDAARVAGPNVGGPMRDVRVASVRDDAVVLVLGNTRYDLFAGAKPGWVTAYSTSTGVDAAIPGDAVVALGKTRTFVAKCDAATDSVEVKAEAPGSAPVTVAGPFYPCPRVEALAVDPLDAPVLLVVARGTTFAPRKR